MQISFTIAQFFAVFVAYNTSVWPMQIFLNLLGILAAGLCFRAAAPSRSIATILAILWIWTGVVYHWMFFSTVNPAAMAFGLLFVIQACLFLYFGAIRQVLVFGFERRWESYLGLVLVL
jgi:hypothetical protein